MLSRVFFGSLALLSALSLGCSSESHRGEGQAGGGGETVSLTGSGASFPHRLYDRWFSEYSQSHSQVHIDYQATGSGAGIKDFINGATDFAASDAAMLDEEMSQVDQGVQLLPITAGQIVFAYHLPGVEQLRLTRKAYVGILLGRVSHWNDPAIAEANPGIELPEMPITVVRRADSSGTTFVLTQHLSAISKDWPISKNWASGPGTGRTVVWPCKNCFIAASKNDGVTAAIRQTPGSIGYVEYGHARLSDLSMASLENKAGQFIAPSVESGQAALANVEIPEHLRAWLPDPEGDEAYPIVTYTWLLCYKKYDDPKKAETLKKIVEYCLHEGQSISDEMGYVPLPENVVDRVSAALDNIQ